MRLIIAPRSTAIQHRPAEWGRLRCETINPQDDNSRAKLQNVPGDSWAMQQQQMAEARAKIAANKAAIEDANIRFGQRDDYHILDEVTIYFGNGMVALDPKYQRQLLQLAEKATGINGYMIQVKGYASSVGSVTLNQQLSEDRADNVAEFLRK